MSVVDALGKKTHAEPGLKVGDGDLDRMRPARPKGLGTVKLFERANWRVFGRDSSFIGDQRCQHCWCYELKWGPCRVDELGTRPSAGSKNPHTATRRVEGLEHGRSPRRGICPRPHRAWDFRTATRRVVELGTRPHAAS